MHAEMLVDKWNAGKHSTYRLGIVVGRHKDGITSTFNAYYVFMSTLWRLKQGLASKSAKELENYRKDGIYFDDRDLVLPINIDFSSTSTLNLIPLDWTVYTLARLIQLPASNKILHVVDPNPRKIRWLNDVSLRILGIKGFRYRKTNIPDSQPLLQKIQRIFDKSTEQYRPYIKHECAFETRNVKNVLRDGTLPFPRTDEKFLERLLNYARLVGFGKKRSQVA